MRDLLYVGLGGFMGSVFRYMLGGWVHRFFPLALFPFGTLTVNVLGCFLIGFVSGVAEHRSLFDAQIRLFLVVGMLGGFTTFSAFGFETFVLAREREMVQALAAVLLHVLLGLAAVWLGYHWARGTS